ncbi:MAG: flavodoxin [Solobacterium sp.]|nr:flavodoxin [Solobacterium sp.]
MKIAIVYYSSTGNTEQMADAVAEGVKSAGGEADVISVSDASAAIVNDYDAFAFGCPAMGAEVLEEGEFDPFFTEIEASLFGKKAGLFGSYGWGDGEWMRNWEDRCREDGIALVSDSVICMEAPDDAALEECRALGRALCA